MELIIDAKGAIRCIYCEELNLRALGTLTISRASHVEPTLEGGWSADLSPVAGPILGPYNQRSDALVAEQQWLEKYWLAASNL